MYALKVRGQPMRASSYNIYVDLSNSPDQMLLVHGYSGTYDLVSRGVAAFVRSLERNCLPKPLHGVWTDHAPVQGAIEPPSEETIEILRRRGYLTTLSAEEEEVLFCKVVENIHRRNTHTAPQYIFMPTYDCNLRCSYCFQDHMRTNPLFSHLLRTMEPAIIDRIFASLGKIEVLHGLGPHFPGPRTFGFFGGEPLLACNRASVEHIMRRARELGESKFWAVTNGTELHAYKDLLGPNAIADLQITLDGIPEEHDRRRVYPDKTGSFDRIAANISMAMDLGARVNVRLNLDRNNLPQLPQLAEVIHSYGWNASPTFSAYTAPIRPENDNVDKKSVLDSWQLDAELARLQKEFPRTGIFGRPDTQIKYQARKIFQQKAEAAIPFKDSFCSAHTRMYIFDCFASIYACWEKTGDISYRMGSVKENGELEMNTQIMEMWRGRTVASNPVCRKCRYALYCGGGCAVLAVGRTGKFHSNFCDGFASVFRNGVGEAYLEHVAGVAMGTGQAKVCDQ